MRLPGRCPACGSYDNDEDEEEDVVYGDVVSRVNDAIRHAREAGPEGPATVGPTSAAAGANGPSGDWRRDRG